MRLKPRKPVNERSINALKRRALVRSKTLRRDAETLEVIQPSKWSVWLSKLKTPFKRSYWEEVLEPTDNESLVDGKLLSYAYLEAGVIETLASYVFVALLDLFGTDKVFAQTGCVLCGFLQARIFAF